MSRVIEFIKYEINDFFKSILDTFINFPTKIKNIKTTTYRFLNKPKTWRNIWAICFLITIFNGERISTITAFFIFVLFVYWKEYDAGHWKGELRKEQGITRLHEKINKHKSYDSESEIIMEEEND